MAPPSSGDQLSKDLSLAEFRQFRDYIHEHSGIFMEDAKADSLRISLVTRATRLDCLSWDEYFEMLGGDEDEFRELMNLVTINETSFFRFPAQFDVLRTVIMPEIAGNRASDNRVMRVWSAGCSTGEEPYSIGMTFLDSGLAALGWKGEVYGTDVSTKALNVARQGIYPAKAVNSVPDDVVHRHFVREANDTYRVSPDVKRCVDFGYHNLIKEPYPLAMRGNWDIIFCRNVTIYFKLESTKRVVANYHSSLNEGGYLFIGHSETLSSISDDFDVVEVGGVFLYRKTKRHSGTVGGRRHSGVGGPPAVPGTGAERARLRTGGHDRDDVAERPAMSERDGRRRDAAAASGTRETPEGRLASARVAMSQGATDEALEAAEIVLEVDPDNAEGHMIAAHAYADTGDFDTALAECERALSVNPLLPGARYLLGVIYQRQGDTARAVSELKKTIYIDPDFALAHLNLGNIHKAQGRYDVAARSYENALRSLHKNPSGVWTLYLGGWQADLIVRTCERSLIECRKAMGAA